ncbi:hypothetical protein VTJ04DRAFT_2277 [Mycothermus thermophilus]|uniref:uncharacterized protein n=1 Tax=Humicola insolens TaxID=85995 RepID=UPI00374410BB
MTRPRPSSSSWPGLVGQSRQVPKSYHRLVLHELRTRHNVAAATAAASRPPSLTNAAPPRRVNYIAPSPPSRINHRQSIGSTRGNTTYTDRVLAKLREKRVALVRRQFGELWRRRGLPRISSISQPGQGQEDFWPGNRGNFHSTAAEVQNSDVNKQPGALQHDEQQSPGEDNPVYHELPNSIPPQPDASINNAYDGRRQTWTSIQDPSTNFDMPYPHDAEATDPNSGLPPLMARLVEAIQQQAQADMMPNPYTSIQQPDIMAYSSEMPWTTPSQPPVYETMPSVVGYHDVSQRVHSYDFSLDGILNSGFQGNDEYSYDVPFPQFPATNSDDTTTDLPYELNPYYPAQDSHQQQPPPSFNINLNLAAHNPFFDTAQQKDLTRTNTHTTRDSESEAEEHDMTASLCAATSGAVSAAGASVDAFAKLWGVAAAPTTTTTTTTRNTPQSSQSRSWSVAKDDDEDDEDDQSHARTTTTTKIKSKRGRKNKPLNQPHRRPSATTGSTTTLSSPSTTTTPTTTNNRPRRTSTKRSRLSSPDPNTSSRSVQLQPQPGQAQSRRTSKSCSPSTSSSNNNIIIYSQEQQQQKTPSPKRLNLGQL